MTAEESPHLQDASSGFDGPAALPHSRNEEELSSADSPKPFIILLVEDNPADVFLIREALATHQVISQIFEANSGEKAFKLADDIDSGILPCPDLIVLDLNLPRISGMKVLERLRASPQCRNQPVAIVTSSDSSTDRAQSAKLGATRYIRKPFDLGGFMAIGGELRALLPVAG